jgi:hypothetical protein
MNDILDKRFDLPPIDSRTFVPFSGLVRLTFKKTVFAQFINNNGGSEFVFHALNGPSNT